MVLWSWIIPIILVGSLLLLYALNEARYAFDREDREQALRAASVVTFRSALGRLRTTP